MNTSIKNICNIDAYIDAPDNATMGNETSSEMITSQIQKPD